MTDEPIKRDEFCDVQCDYCKALHPLRQKVGDALACMDRLNNTQRPCPSCGRKGQWVVRRDRREGAARD